MTEAELRTLVREAVARHTGAAPAIGSQPGMSAYSTSGVMLSAARVPGLHVSHGMFTLPIGADADGPCVIEPAVPCTHCGYCKSYGH